MVVDEYLRTADPEIYAIGDVAVQNVERELPPARVRAERHRSRHVRGAPHRGPEPASRTPQCRASGVIRRRLGCRSPGSRLRMTMRCATRARSQGRSPCGAIGRVGWSLWSPSTSPVSTCAPASSWRNLSAVSSTILEERDDRPDTPRPTCPWSTGSTRPRCSPIPTPATHGCELWAPSSTCPGSTGISSPTHASVTRAEQHPDLFSAHSSNNTMVRAVGGRPMLRKDDPEHGVERSAINPTLRPRAVGQGWAPRFRATVEKWLDHLAEVGPDEAELNRDFAGPVAAQNLIDLVGFPADVDVHDMWRWSADFIAGIANLLDDSDVWERCDGSRSETCSNPRRVAPTPREGARRVGDLTPPAGRPARAGRPRQREPDHLRWHERTSAHDHQLRLGAERAPRPARAASWRPGRLG